MWKTFLDLIFPPKRTCAVCAKKDKMHQDIDLCWPCLEQVELVKAPFCQKCGKPWSYKGAEERLVNCNQPDSLCLDCKKHKHNFGVARGITVYNGIIQDAIHRLKFQHARREAEWLGQLLAMGMKIYPEIMHFDLIIPVPLSRERLLERGYNQAELLARVVASYYKRPVLGDCLKRIKVTETQSKLSRAERFANIRGAFSIEQTEDINGKNILVIDDVFTTGSTTDECARVLVGEGAANVWVLTLATGKIVL